ncbi:zinc ribbon domain-containing protein [Limosilactobacillus reuteri]|uniref:zinc ribbon domain-containing protein n=1 Tax=Limosilactobacillus reuteri TaxID=1598 RepID=UPI001E47DB5A|nr:zinc ribbon domain-containing protein [Limosilactobacillus reuteri]MCC4380387.1 zinc-ribbon domain-containing protein [Limosilactobacillus reuteri]
MKFCPNCGNKLKQDDKFCEKCGRNLSQNKIGRSAEQAKSQILNKLKNLGTSWFKKDKHRQYTIGAVIVLIFLILFAGHIHNNGGSIVTPKNVSFSKANKGTRIWFSADGTAKDSKVTEVIRLRGDKATKYDVYDDSITLGKLSSMSNSRIMQLAKYQDKKSFSHIVKDWNLYNDIPNPSYTFYDLYNHEPNCNIEVINSDNDGLYFDGNGKILDQISNETGVDDDELPLYSENNKNINVASTLKSAFQRSLDSVDYKGPRTAEIYTKATTDSSGNETISQFLSIPSTYYDNTDVCNNNFYNICKSNPTIVKKIISYEKETRPYITNITSLSEYDEAFSKFVKPIIDSRKFQNQYTKNAFKSQNGWDKFNLNYTTSFKIYNSRFIGYGWTYNKASGVLVTKAQNDQQKAVFAKPSN